MNLSVVIPVYNEEAGLPALFARLYPALDKLGVAYEVIFVNDGSRDRSAAVLREQFQKRPDVTRVVLLNGNFGQHMAIMAGFERCRGERPAIYPAGASRASCFLHDLAGGYMPPADILRRAEEGGIMLTAPAEEGRP